LTPTISLFDGSQGSGKVLQIAQSGLVTANVATFNDVLKTMSSFTCRTDTLGEAGGINALEVISMTNIPTNFPSNNNKVVEKTNRMIQRENLPAAKRAEFQLGPFDNISLIGVTSQTPIRKDAWTGIQKFWIKPVFSAKIGAGLVDNTDIYTICTYGNEPYNMSFNISNLANAVNTTSLSTVHLQYASLLFQSLNSKDPQICNLLDEWAEKGRGGILSGIVETLAKILPF